MAIRELTFDDVASGDIKDDISMMGIYLYQQYSKRFALEDNPNVNLASVLMSFLVEAHRAEPGSTGELVSMLGDAADWLERDRKCIVEHKLKGWESYK